MNSRWLTFVVSLAVTRNWGAAVVLLVLAGTGQARAATRRSQVSQVADGQGEAIFILTNKGPGFDYGWQGPDLDILSLKCTYRF